MTQIEMRLELKRMGMNQIQFTNLMKVSNSLPASSWKEEISGYAEVILEFLQKMDKEERLIYLSRKGII